MIHPSNSLRCRARGRWFAVLSKLGVDRSYLCNKHGPCPVCGGTDRFRWDDKNGDGTFYCNQCGPGSGIDLVMRIRGLPFREAALLIEGVIVDHPSLFPGGTFPLSRSVRSEASIRDGLNALWRSGEPVRIGDPADLWLRHRGISVPVYPTSLRTALRVYHRAPPATFHPVMLARVTDPTGRPCNLHKTYLSATGAKASVEPVRMFCRGKMPPGSAVRLAPVGPVLGVAEGIETALAAQLLFGFPVWACLSASQLMTFEPAIGTQRLVVCGDNDADGTGQRAAYTLASRLATRLPLEVRIPDETDTDWNDVLRQAEPLPWPFHTSS
jgi:putative DNA primase/helicase